MTKSFDECFYSDIYDPFRETVIELTKLAWDSCPSFRSDIQEAVEAYGLPIKIMHSAAVLVAEAILDPASIKLNIPVIQDLVSKNSQPLESLSDDTIITILGHEAGHLKEIIFHKVDSLCHRMVVRELDEAILNRPNLNGLAKNQAQEIRELLYAKTDSRIQHVIVEAQPVASEDEARKQEGISPRIRYCNLGYIHPLQRDLQETLKPDDSGFFPLPLASRNIHDLDPFPVGTTEERVAAIISEYKNLFVELRKNGVDVNPEEMIEKITVAAEASLETSYKIRDMR